MANRRHADPAAGLTPIKINTVVIGGTILALMAEGRSNQGICGALWLSPKTVEAHIRNVFAKLGITAAAEDNRRVLAVLTYLRR